MKVIKYLIGMYLNLIRLYKLKRSNENIQANHKGTWSNSDQPLMVLFIKDERNVF